MLAIQTYAHTWPMCLGFLVFFGAIGALAYWVRAPRLDCALSAARTFWVCLILWLLSMSVCLTLIDEPHLSVSQEAKQWMFMVSAFLGIPLTMPLFAGMVWALAFWVRGEPVRLSALSLVMLAGFGLGCAASNAHDVVWCGVITSAYTQHYKAGYDLAVFVAIGQWFGLKEELLADYAVLGPCALVLILGELFVSAVSFVRLKHLLRP